MIWIKLALWTPVALIAIWMAYQFYKLHKIHRVMNKVHEARKPKNEHEALVPHTHEATGKVVLSCYRCGWPEDKIEKHKVMCTPLGISKCDIELRNPDDPVNPFFCKTHNNVSPNAHWCLTAAIDVITEPPRI